MLIIKKLTADWLSYFDYYAQNTSCAVAVACQSERLASIIIKEMLLQKQ